MRSQPSGRRLEPHPSRSAILLPLPTFDLSSQWGRLRAVVDFLWTDHAWIRLRFQNAHWVSPDLVRTNQPWPYQLKAWRDLGIRTVLNLRGDAHKSHHVLEADACHRLGLKLVDFRLNSREAPTLGEVERARELFETIDYPCLVHCKSGADRAGVLSVLYAHYRLGEPISQALANLSKKHGHFREGLTGVLDYTFERYVAEGEPKGLSLAEWMARPEYDRAAIKADFKAQWWGKLLTDRLLRRE